MIHRRAVLLLPGLVALWGCRSSADAAWRRVQAALDSHNNLEAVRACEAYLTSMRTPDRNSVRTAQVKRAYRRAFVHWLVALPGKPDTDDMKHIQNFRTLMGDSSSEGEKP